MKRQTQKTGVRTYFGDDLVDLQTQPLNAIDAMLAAAGRCVISGCQVTKVGDKYNVAPGYVALEATDQVTDEARIMAMPFDGVSGVKLPVYLVAKVDVVERAYGDGAVKPIAYSYSAAAVAVKPAQNTSIEIAADYARGLADALAESLAKYIAVTAIEKATWNAKETPAGAQTKAAAAQAAAKDYTDGAVAGKANANHSHGVATADADGFMAKGDKSKLDGVAASANNYTHPADASTRHVTDAEKAVWGGKASTAVATTSANGLMSGADKSKLNGIAAGANNYTHPADASTRHVTDAEKAAWGGKADGRIFKPTGIDLPTNAVINMPGVLCAGEVERTGVITRAWGCKPFNVEKYEGKVGHYKITHNIGHYDYFTSVNIYGGIDGIAIGAFIALKAKNYVVVNTVNWALEQYDYSFEFILCGRN